MATVQSIVDLARIPMNDADKTTPDDILLTHLNSAMNQLMARRADIFVGSALMATDIALLMSDTMPIESKYHQAVADYVTARTFSDDDVKIELGKAASFFALSSGGV